MQTLYPVQLISDDPEGLDWIDFKCFSEKENALIFNCMTPEMRDKLLQVIKDSEKTKKDDPAFVQWQAD